MVALTRFMTIICLAFVFSGCSLFRHDLSVDYQEYLANNGSDVEFPQTNYTAQYVLTSNTANHYLEFRDIKVGIANLWIVRFGELLETTLRSNHFENAFQRLSKFEGGRDSGTMIIQYNVVDYKFVDGEAWVTLQVSVLKSGSVVFDKTYFQSGTDYSVDLFFNGPFVMKSVWRKSTRDAVETILAKSLNDMIAQGVR